MSGEVLVVDDDEASRRLVRHRLEAAGYEAERERHYRAPDAQNERLDEFAGALAHDLRNPLAAAQGYAELAAETASEPEAEYLEVVLDSLGRMGALVTETLSLAREGIDVGEREPVEFSAVARAAWESVDPETATLELTADRTVLADSSRLRLLFGSLFRNVDEHCGPGVTVTVEDTGPGLDRAVADSLFDGDFGEGRRGIGLLVVERVTSGQGWRGAVETGDGGTRFVFSGVEAPAGPPRTV